jgi:hypothetical protein
VDRNDDIRKRAAEGTSPETLAGLFSLTVSQLKVILLGRTADQKIVQRRADWDMTDAEIAAVTAPTRRRSSPRHRFIQQRAGANRRGIPWRLTFGQWWRIWQESGHWEERGCERGQYCMCRPGDQGAYELGNVIIALHSANSSEATRGKKRTPSGKIIRP